MQTIYINGANGRMGRAIAALLDTAGFAQAESAAGAAAIIDFSSPAGTVEICKHAAAARVPLVIGTTGLSAEQETEIHQAAGQIPVIYSGNFSMGVTVLTDMVQRAAAALPTAFDIEIFEAHHAAKVDAPSGTALMLGRAAAIGRGQTLDAVQQIGRAGHTGARTAGAIGFSSARGGDVVGDHTVFFYGSGERVEISHRATDRAIFARGALHAARWLIGKPAGLYSMRDVLGL